MGSTVRHKEATSIVAAVGDAHGHLQLALCALARWQQELDIRFEAVLLCGDVGTFSHDSQLDNATRRHARENPCELEFLSQWAARPQAPWLGSIFRDEEDGGLGLTCPVLMVHGNHEGFEHLRQLVPSTIPSEPVEPSELPGVDTDGHIRLLPSGWTTALPSGLVVGGVGGIQAGQRRAQYHEMAYIDEEAVLALLERGEVDILLTHQGPSQVQGEVGADLLQPLLDEGVAPVWFHGHSIAAPEVTAAGRRRQTTVVPLDDIAFPARGHHTHEPGRNGWAWAEISRSELRVEKAAPRFLREFRRHLWVAGPGGQLVCPPLARAAWGARP